MRNNYLAISVAAVSIVIVVAVAALIGGTYALYRASDDNFHFELDLRLYHNSAGIYRADADMASGPTSYFDWLGGDGQEAIPSDGDSVSVRIYEGTTSNKKETLVWSTAVEVARASSGHTDRTVEGNMDLDYSANVHLWVYVLYDGGEIGQDHVIIGQSGRVVTV